MEYGHQHSCSLQQLRCAHTYLQVVPGPNGLTSPRVSLEVGDIQGVQKQLMAAVCVPATPQE
jgi:hypothetical protein